jgi:peptidoglycan/LPS O-acetylase OafA/YrhL
VPWTYRPELDGLRAVAVYLVLLFHAGLPWAHGGFIGVDLFFVLSGFLVTSVILSEIDMTGALRLGNFYSRRVRRLLPAAVVVIVATSLVFVLIASSARRVPLVGDAQSALLYAANWHFLAQSGDYFATGVDKSPFLHFWSLAIEEQYYFVYPLLVVALSRFSRRRMVSVLSVLFGLSLAAQLVWAQLDTNHAYYGTDARLYQLLAGSLCAVAIRTWSPRVAPRTAGVIAATGLVGVVLLGSGLVTLSPSLRGIGATGAAALAISGLVLDGSTRPARVLGRPVPVFLGRISYGTYLWHWPVILVATTVLDVSPAVVAVLALAVATGLAAASYEVLEMPIRRSKHLDRIRWYPALVGVTVSALVAATVVPWALQMNRRPALVANDSVQRPAVAGARSSARVPAGIDWTAVRHDIGKEGSCDADTVEACTVVKGSGPHVLLIGDSQAEMLVPMFEQIAKDHGLTLSLNVRAGCLWQEGLTNLKASPEGQQQCEDARVGWYDEVLPKLRPDVVIILDRPRDDPDEWQDVVQRRDGKQQSLETKTIEASRDTLRRITEVVPTTLLVERLVMPETFDPAECLSTVERANRCAVPVPMDVSPSDGYYVTAAAGSRRVATLNLNPAFCPSAPVCAPVVDGDVVWRDDHHVTARYGVARREQVWRILKDAIPGTAER